MKNVQCLIISWSGNKMPDAIVRKIAQVFVDNNVCIPEMLNATYLDETGVNEVLVKSVIANDKRVPEDSTAIKNAIVYIGTRFANTLSDENHNIVPFIIELNDAVINAYHKYSIGMFANVEPEDSALLKAVEILATAKRITITTDLKTKYRFSTTVVDAIRSVYNKYHYHII